MSKQTKPEKIDLSAESMAEDIRRIDLKAFQSAGTLLKAVEELVKVVDGGGMDEDLPTRRLLELLKEAQKEARRCERRRKELP